jgi:hypothetical protein
MVVLETSWSVCTIQASKGRDYRKPQRNPSWDKLRLSRILNLIFQRVSQSDLHSVKIHHNCGRTYVTGDIEGSWSRE